MTDRPALLFLHGVGNGDPENVWLTHLEKSLEALGYPGLQGVEYVAPKYAHALTGVDDPPPALAPITTTKLGREEARANRRDFERRIGSIETRFGRLDRGKRLGVLDVGVKAAVELPAFSQARNYVKNVKIRAQVLSRILPVLPSNDRLVIVAHSLGSIIAADLVPRLPKAVAVSGLITIGSPLANGSLDVSSIIAELDDPPPHLEWWINFWNGADPVASHRGLSSVIPWLLDFRIDSGTDPMSAHAASAYLRDPNVAGAIGFAVHGSLSREIARSGADADLALDLPEQLALIALRYGHLIAGRLTGEVRSRFLGALRHVQGSEIATLIRLREDAGRPIPLALAKLEVDLTDPRADAVEPAPVGYFTREDAIIPLLLLAATNILQPFEIDVPKNVMKEAIRDLTGELGLTSQYGIDVLESTKRAREILRGADELAWIKWVAVGAGAAALVVATGGLALAAAPGLVGAAAITSALAAFGPGGMVGGLLTAGTLATAGGSGIAFGLASSGTSAEAFEDVVERRLAAAILRDRLKLPVDSGVWRTLVEVEMELRREHEKLDEYSDRNAVSVKTLKKKISAVELALEYLAENHLAPNPEAELTQNLQPPASRAVEASGS